MKPDEKAKKITNFSNFLTFLRAPLALFFLSSNLILRITAIVFAMVTDGFDGYLARKNRTVTQFGAVFDPAMDKFFVAFALTFLVLEQKLFLWQACAIISRDFFLIFFGIYLGLSGHWQAYQCKSVRWGKASTALQFFALIAITLDFKLHWSLYAVFILLGSLTFKELSVIPKENRAEKTADS